MIPNFINRNRDDQASSASLMTRLQNMQNEYDNSDEPRPPNMDRVRSLILNNPFGRHIIIVNDLENADDQQRFLQHMQALSQDETIAGSEFINDSP